MKSHLPRVISLFFSLFRGRKERKRKKKLVWYEKSVLPSASVYSYHRWTDGRHSREGVGGHKSRQLKKSCWLFKTSTPTQTEMKILYRGEVLQAWISSHVLLSPLLHSLLIFLYSFLALSSLPLPTLLFQQYILERGRRQSLFEIVSLECERRARENWKKWLDEGTRDTFGMKGGSSLSANPPSPLSPMNLYSSYV